MHYRIWKKKRTMSWAMSTESETVAGKLRNLNSPIAEQQVIMTILQTITRSYRPFLSAWQSVPPAEHTINNLTTRLVGEEIMNIEGNDPGETDPVDSAYFAARATELQQRSWFVDQGMAAREHQSGYPRGIGGSRGCCRRCGHNYRHNRGGQH